MILIDKTPFIMKCASLLVGRGICNKTELRVRSVFRFGSDLVEEEVMGSCKTTKQGTDNTGSDLRAPIASIENGKRNRRRSWLALGTLPRPLLLLVFILTARALLFGQTTNGLMTGVITDSSGAVVADAQIRINNQGTNALRTATSDNKGYYVIPQLA